MRRTSQTAEQALAAAFTDEWGRVVAALIRRTGDWGLAEECAQEAFTQAAARWPVDGIPVKPGAWLTTVAANRAIDRLRRAKRGDELMRAATEADPDSARSAPSAEEQAMRDLLSDDQPIDDDRLRLIFTCCHPALALEARVALTLRSLTGLTTAEIARAFLVPEATMSKRLTRAKAKIAAAGIPYRVPPASQLPDRLGGVLSVLYLLYNEGYSASSGEDLIRRDLCAEAIRLTRLLHEMMPDEGEVAGLLALMLLGHSRREARTDQYGDLVTLEEQDRGRWDREEIDDAHRLTEAALTLGSGQAGPYLIQALISACHAEARAADETDWQRIAILYTLLQEVSDTPVVALNRAVAVAMAGDTTTALRTLDELAAAGTLSDYHLLYAARAELLRRRAELGDLRDAAAAYRQALALSPSEPERRHLQRRLSKLQEAG